MARKRYPKKEENKATDQEQVDLRNYAADATFAQFMMTMATAAAVDILKSDYGFDQEKANEFALKFVRKSREKVRAYSKAA